MLSKQRFKKLAEKCVVLKAALRLILMNLVSHFSVNFEGFSLETD